MIQLAALDRKNQAHVHLMYNVRTHPDVDRYLCQPPPASFTQHMEYLGAAEESGKKHFFIISFQEHLCGYCHVTVRADTLELGWALHPDWWGQGIGKRSVSLLVQFLQASPLSQGKTLTLIVKKDNARAIAIYKNQGFIILRENANQEYEMQYLAISVVVSTYCRNYGDATCANFLERAIGSILAQTFAHFELLLIDDGSTDGSAEVCKKYAMQDDRIRYIRFEQNSGLPAKRYNHGIHVSQGKWIAFMFDDDEWLPNALADLYQAIVTLPPIYGMVNGTVQFYCVQNGISHIAYPDFGMESSSLRRLFTRNRIANNSVLVRREVFDLVGGYDEAPCMRRMCDWDLWLRIAMRYKIKAIPHRVAHIYEGLPDSILRTHVSNPYLIYVRQWMFFREQPLKKYAFRMSPEQWLHFFTVLCSLPFYLSLRYTCLFLQRMRKLRKFFPKKWIQALQPILRAIEKNI